MSFENAVKQLMVSFDLTINANLSVGMPVDLQIYEKDSFEVGLERRFERDEPQSQAISIDEGEALKNALGALLGFKF